MAPCPGSGEQVAGPGDRVGRVKCETCGRHIAVNSGGRLFRHVPKVSNRSRMMAERIRIDQVIRAQRYGPPSHGSLIALRWWFRDYGGAEAFERFAAPVPD